MPFEDWQNENKNTSLLEWQEQNAATENLNATPEEAFDDAGQIWDSAVDADIPLNEAENMFHVSTPPKPEPDGYVKRMGKAWYNTAVANVVTAVGTKSEVGKMGTDVKTLVGLETNFRQRLAAGEPVTEHEIEFYAKPFEKGTIGSLFRRKQDDWKIKLWKDFQEGNVNVGPPPTAEEAMERYLGISREAEQEQFESYDISIPPTPPRGFVDKSADAIGGLLGVTTQIGVMSYAAPSMPQWLVWENVNIMNGGQPGQGAAMQLTLGGMQKAIPGIGFVPAAKRGALVSGLFGTTTYLGGGDTVDVLIAMGIPFAFEGIGMTKQQWAKYKNKDQMIKAIKEKAPALKNRSDMEIEGAVSKLLTNVEMKAKFGKKTTKQPEISAQLKDHMQRAQYDKLLAKANAGNKQAIKELNDFIQGKNIPTYEQLLEQGYNGDVSAFDKIQLGQYKGGTAEPKAELKIPKGKKPGADYKPKTPIQKIKEQAKFAENADTQPGKLDTKTTQKSRERGFITSTKEVVPELKIEGQYIPRPTDPLSIKARNLVKDNITLAEKLRKTPNDKGVATASELIKHYSERARAAKTQVDADIFFDKAAIVANETAVMLTEAGRTVQAASILGRLTPEGQVRFAAREIQRYNEVIAKKKGGVLGLKKKLPELNAKQAKRILTDMERIQQMPEGKARWLEFNKLQKFITSLVPTPLHKKVTTVWRAGLLTGIKTSGLNIYSNIGHLGTETIKDIPASMVDKAVSYFTGKRTVTPTVKGLGKGSLEGTGKGFEYLKTGYSDRDIGTKFDYKRVNMGKGTIMKALQAYTEGIFRVLGAEDQPFYYAAKLRSMYQQAKVSAMNLKLKGKKAQAHINKLMENPTEKMIKNASMDAETAVYINRTKLGDIARGVQQLPGGEFVVPFSRTPSAVAMQIVNYSPAGIAKTIIQNIGKGRFDQRAFSQGMGRGLTGTAVMAIGTAMFDNDLITLDRPTTERERKLWELDGRPPNSVKIGDKWRSVHTFGAAGNLLIIGGHFRRAFTETGSPTEAMTEALGGTAKSFTEQTFVRGTKQVIDLISDPERSASYVAGGFVSSIVPTIVGDTARAIDPKERRADTIGEKVVSRIPGARQTLEPKITVLGEEKEPTANPLELMIDPTRPSKEISTPVIDELGRLWKQGWEVSPNLLGDRKGYDVLTPEENTELWKQAGTITKEALDEVFKTEKYLKQTDQEKAADIEKIIIASQTGARDFAVAKKLEGLEGEERAKALFPLRESGLASQELIPIALSRRNPRKARKDKK